MSLPELITKIQALNNPAADAVCQVWSQRERDRSDTNVQTLHVEAQAVSQAFTKEQLYSFFNFLEKQGLGKLTRSPQGLPRFMSGMKHGVKAIGKAYYDKSVASSPSVTATSPKTIPYIKNGVRKVAHISIPAEDLTYAFHGGKITFDKGAPASDVLKVINRLVRGE